LQLVILFIQTVKSVHIDLVFIHSRRLQKKKRKKAHELIVRDLLSVKQQIQVGDWLVDMLVNRAENQRGKCEYRSGEEKEQKVERVSVGLV
ncbi:hypothetical protein GBF38_003411, partial [Nibea albiflora]